MREKLLKLFDDLNPENQTQILDYALMLWEMEQGEKQLSETLGLNLAKEDIQKIAAAEQYITNKDPKDIN
jgi:hypothetical protein